MAMLFYDHENDYVEMHYEHNEKIKALIKRRSFWRKEKLFFKDKSF